MPCCAIVRSYIMIVVTSCTYADSKVAIVAFQRLRLVGASSTACAAYVPILTAILTHEEVEVLAVVCLAIDEVGNECTVTLLECRTRARETTLPRLRIGIITVGTKEGVSVVNGSFPSNTTVVARNSLPARRFSRY